MVTKLENHNILIVVDMQNDFIDGSLGTKEAQAIVPAVVEKINGFDGDIFYTMDSHYSDYADTQEGKRLPIQHCKVNTDGWQVEGSVKGALVKAGATPCLKSTFGSNRLPGMIRNTLLKNRDIKFDENINIEIIGLCTDICVVSNAILIKTEFPEAHVSVDASCCAGVTPETHNAAIATMRMCQIDVL